MRWVCRLIGHRWSVVKRNREGAPGSYYAPGTPLLYTFKECTRCREFRLDITEE